MMKHLRNRKGLAMEMAIATMLIIFAMCSVLLVIAEMTGILNKRTVDTATSRVSVDSIGEDFFRAHRYNATFYAEQYAGKYTPVVQRRSSHRTSTPSQHALPMKC